MKARMQTNSTERHGTPGNSPNQTTANELVAAINGCACRIRIAAEFESASARRSRKKRAVDDAQTRSTAKRWRSAGGQGELEGPETQTVTVWVVAAWRAIFRDHRSGNCPTQGKLLIDRWRLRSVGRRGGASSTVDDLHLVSTNPGGEDFCVGQVSPQ